MKAGTQNMYGTARINGPEMIRGRDHETLRYNGTRTWDWDRSARIRIVSLSTFG